MKNKKSLLILISIIVLIVISIFIINKIKISKIQYEISKIDEYKYFLYKEGDNYGVIDKEGKIIIEATYSEIVIPNLQKDVFVCYTEEEIKTLNSKNEEIFTEFEEVEAIRLVNSASTLCYEKSVLKYKNNELYDESMEADEIDFNETLDINDMLFDKADLKLDITKEKKPKKKATKKQEKIDDEEEIVKVKKVNLNNITNLIFEMHSKNSKDPDSVRVPNYVRTMIPEFFALDEAQSEEINGAIYKVKNIKLELVDVKANQKYQDNNAKITYKPKQSYLSFVSEYLSNVMYEEDDIIRIIKLADDEYHVEIVDKKMQEYKVWKKLCNQSFRASTKKFGMM